MTNPGASTAVPSARSAAYTLFSTPDDEVVLAAPRAGRMQFPALSSGHSGQLPAVDSSTGPMTVAAGAAFRVSPSGQITGVRLQLQTQGVSPELAARLIARLAAGQHARGVHANGDAPDSLPAPASPTQQARERIFHDIEALYQETRTKVPDSPIVTEFCLKALRQARLLVLSAAAPADLRVANSYLEIVRAKLARSVAGRRDDGGQIDAIIALTFASFIIACPLALLPWLAPAGSLGSFRLPPDFLPLLAALGWGAIGGIAATLYHLPWFVQLREYDSAYYMEYLGRPAKGFAIGGALFIALFLGESVLNLSVFPSGGGVDSPLVLLAAFVAGFKQEQVWKLIDSALRKTPLASSGG